MKITIGTWSYGHLAFEYEVNGITHARLFDPSVLTADEALDIWHQIHEEETLAHEI